MKPKVSTYRLVTHLSIALTSYSILFWNALNLLRNNHILIDKLSLLNMMKIRKYGIYIIHFVALNLLSGAMVAGIEGGKVYNSWPLMNGQFIPIQYFEVFLFIFIF